MNSNKSKNYISKNISSNNTNSNILQTIPTINNNALLDALRSALKPKVLGKEHGMYEIGLENQKVQIIQIVRGIVKDFEL